MKVKEKRTITHYYVQVKQEGQDPQIVYHTHDKETNEYHHKFLDRKKAKALAKAEKKITPEHQFRVVKCKANYVMDEWI